MKILLASSEAHPYSKTGGLADMAGALAKYLARAGEEVKLVTPLYAGIKERHPKVKKTDITIDLPLAARRIQAGLWQLKPQPNLTIFFVDQPDFFQRAGIYQESGVSYPDNAARFIFFSKTVVYLARYADWAPEIVHTHDWQTGLVPLFMAHQRLHEKWTNVPGVCFTIHNLAYQGNFPTWDYPLTNLPWDYFHPHGIEFYGDFSCIKAGLVYSDLITTVSPRYAREIATEQYGCGLDGLLRARQSSLVGILNGVDYTEWTTENNPFLKTSFNREQLERKTEEKVQLQKELSLPQGANIPLFGTVSRLADQKGMDILLGALEEMLASEMQFVLLGSGQPEFERAFLNLEQRHSSKVAVRIGFDMGLSHRIEAACDFFLMPSKFEPCGLNQMYSLRYGTIPIVRATGGLDDSVIDISQESERANGIKFYDVATRGLVKAMRKALVLYSEPELLKHYRLNAMEADFSWERTAAEYSKVYAALVRGPEAKIRGRKKS